MERQALALLLRGKQPVVICPARSIETMRVPAVWKPALERGRLLIVSPFPAQERRVTRERALRRNRLVAALAAEIMITYAAAGSGTEAFAREIATGQKPCYTLAAPETHALQQLGFRAVPPQSWPPQP